MRPPCGLGDDLIGGKGRRALSRYSLGCFSEMRLDGWFWARRGLRIGLATSAPVLAGVLLIWLVPALIFGYPLVLLPLLLAGPLSVPGASVRRALSTAALAGWVSAIVATASLAFGANVLGTTAWGLTTQASMAPVPTWLPRVDVLPTAIVTWAQQDLLFGLPSLAIGLAALGSLGRTIASRLAPHLGSLLPGSLNARLQLTMCALTGVTLLVGWVSFSALEDMHFRGHQVQLYVRWQSLIDEVRTSLEAEALANANGSDTRSAAQAVDAQLTAFRTTTSFPGVAASATSIRALASRYTTLLDAATDAAAAYHADPRAPLTRHAATAALIALEQQIDADMMALVDTDDAVHHAWLFLVMIVAGLGAGFGMWMGQASVAAISGPIGQLGAHLARVAGGDFSGRVRPRGPRELHSLADDMNRMTADLDRLYAVERTMFQEQLRHQAFHDPLTGLPNRALLRDRVEHAQARSDRQFQPLGVLVINLDNFKIINDSLGHQQGDELLQVVAERLLGCSRAGDTAARLGGDEFTILLEDVSHLEEVTLVAERVVSALSLPIPLDGRDVFVSASIGIALSTPAHTSPETLLRDADLAMHHAKSAGKGRWEVYDESFDTLAVERLDVEMDLRAALDRGEFFLDYQPIVQLSSGDVLEVEALVRWNHPRRGRVAPDAFIAIAEETGLIVPLGFWVLEEACRQARRWHDCFPERPPLVMSVNLSARQFQHPGLVAHIADVVRRTRIDPSYLKLEITESVLMQGVDTTVETLRALKALHIQLAIDDFGTGYSSLSYLKRFPVDTLKIDRSFVKGLGHDQQDTAIVRSVVNLAKTLNLSVTAEGIETVAQQYQLTTLGCDLGQGFLLARPSPAAALEDLLRNGYGPNSSSTNVA
jgi:diguanylate cyclase (GGDEF)-like protein